MDNQPLTNEQIWGLPEDELLELYHRVNIAHSTIKKHGGMSTVPFPDASLGDKALYQFLSAKCEKHGLKKACQK